MNPNAALARALGRSRKRASFALNRAPGRYESVVWLAGDGRSGTTWAMTLINWNRRLREVFEPLHPRIVPAMKR